MGRGNAERASQGHISGWSDMADGGILEVERSGRVSDWIRKRVSPTWHSTVKKSEGPVTNP